MAPGGKFSLAPSHAPTVYVAPVKPTPTPTALPTATPTDSAATYEDLPPSIVQGKLKLGTPAPTPSPSKSPTFAIPTLSPTAFPTSRDQVLAVVMRASVIIHTGYASVKTSKKKRGDICRGVASSAGLESSRNRGK